MHRREQEITDSLLHVAPLIDPPDGWEEALLSLDVGAVEVEALALITEQDRAVWEPWLQDATVGIVMLYLLAGGDVEAMQEG
ncbi:hypothetical protein Dda_7034 [Drechslerella dactyloides]|uniref:Uncharacterized protein n=1 Tax=Drechslerella dactyloides TaxID=74499 RepID=A0AAD6IT22_DREDA|nr:hypothetical protein Dda_7034 [Drechslerella dactyloides]